MTIPLSPAVAAPVTEIAEAARCAGRLWDAVSSGDEAGAAAVVLDAIDAGLTPESALLDVVGAVQRRVGDEWAAGRLSVAGEHAITALNERVISAVSAAAARGRPPTGRRRVTVACVDGEWHALPARLLAEVLRLRGFTVDHLGAQIPTPHLVEHLLTTGPAAVALSGSIPTRLPAAHTTIAACLTTGTPVIAGGPAFGADGRHARLLGAQAWAPDARIAADLLATGLPSPGGPAQPLDVLPHLADQEYTMVARTTAHLVAVVHTGLQERHPALRETAGLAALHVRDELTQTVEFLTTALYTGDDTLLTEHIGWAADVATARRLAPHVIVDALDLFALELRDFPRATQLLSAARVDLAARRVDA